LALVIVPPGLSSRRMNSRPLLLIRIGWDGEQRIVSWRTRKLLGSSSQTLIWRTSGSLASLLTA